MSCTANISCFKPRHEMPSTNKLLTNKFTTIYQMQKNLQLKDIYNLEVSKFMYKYTNSKLPATFNNCFKCSSM